MHGLVVGQMYTFRLPLAVVRMNRERSALVAFERYNRIARVFIDAVDAFVPPVGHKQIVLEQSDAIQITHLKNTKIKFLAFGSYFLSNRGLLPKVLS